MRALSAAVLSLILSANASAGLIHVSADWYAPEMEDPVLREQFQGKVSWYFEEGSKTISEMIFFDSNEKALLSLLGEWNVDWWQPLGTRAPGDTRMWNGGNAAGSSSRLVDLRNGSVMNLGTWEMIAVTGDPAIAPTLDHFIDQLSGGIYNDQWAFAYTLGNAVRTKVTASVPEPGTLGLLAAGMALIHGLRRRRSPEGGDSGMGLYA